MSGAIGRLVAIGVGLAAASAVFAGVAQGATFSASPTRTVPIGTFGPGGYGSGFDGTFWTVRAGANTGVVGHVDDEGNDLGDGFSFPYSGFYPLSIGYYGGRVFITHGASIGPQMMSLQVDSADPGHERISADAETGYRMGGNQKILRTFPNGTAAIALGQSNKIGTFDLTGGSASNPWYPQAFMGIGINSPYNPAGNPFETCVVGTLTGPVVGEPTPCGQNLAPYGPNHFGFNYPNDIAPGPGGLYVSEWIGDRVTHVLTGGPGATIGLRFGQGPGTAAGQLDGPQSIAIQPGTSNLFVSEADNRRISVFNAAGGYIASFGYGVRDGANAMQVCGVGIGTCQAGVHHNANPSSYFSRLDFGPDGELYAYMPLRGQIQIFAVDGSGPSTPTGPSGPGPATPGTPPRPGPAVKDRVRLSAAPLQVRKGKRTTLTANVNPPATCTARRVRFQAKAGRSWTNLGNAIKPSKSCKAKIKRRINAKTVFRAVLLRPSGAKLGQSPNVTVKLKR